MNPAKWKDLEDRRPQHPSPIHEASNEEWQAYLAQMNLWLKEKQALVDEEKGLKMVFVRQTPVVTPKADYQFRDLPKGRRKTA